VFAHLPDLILLALGGAMGEGTPVLDQEPECGQISDEEFAQILLDYSEIEEDIESRVRQTDQKGRQAWLKYLREVDPPRRHRGKPT
jgi:hypothetical protein